MQGDHSIASGLLLPKKWKDSIENTRSFGTI